MKIELASVHGEEINLLVAGDLAFPLLAEVANPDFDGLYADDLLDVLHEKDISMVNLECPLTSRLNPIQKNGPNISAHPSVIESLKIAKFDVAVLANNHVMDQGGTGMEETLSVCKGAGIKTVGAGMNLQKASSPLFVEVKNRKIAFLAFTEEEFSCATDTSPGAAKLDLAIACSAIQDAKKEADMIVVNIHGGNEFYHIPSPRMQIWYRFLVDCGADAVIGHHTHAVQGIEVYNDVPIIYNLGTFVFPKKGIQPKCWYTGLIIKLKIADNGVCSLDLFPIKQSGLNSMVKGELCKGDEKIDFTKRFERLSQIASDPVLVSEFWKCFCYYRKNSYFGDLKMVTTGLGADLVGLTKRAIKNLNISYISCMLPNFMSYQTKSVKRQKMLKLKNYISCPAHHEVLKTIIEMERRGLHPAGEYWDEFKSSMFCCDQ